MITKYKIFEGYKNEYDLEDEISQFYNDDDESDVFIAKCDEYLNNLLAGKFVSFYDEYHDVQSGLFGSASVEFQYDNRPTFYIRLGEVVHEMDNGYQGILVNTIADDEESKVRWYKGGKLSESNVDSVGSFIIEDVANECVQEYGEFPDTIMLKNKLEDLVLDKLCEFNEELSDSSNEKSQGNFVKGIVTKVWVSNFYDIELTIYFVVNDKMVPVYPGEVWVYNTKKKEKKVRVNKNPDIDPYGEEKWDDDNINENANRNMKSFIPFEIRDQIDPNFEISDIEDYSEMDLSKNQEYLKIIKRKIIGNMVEFYSYNYLKKFTSKEPVKLIINDVGYNADGILVFVGRGDTKAVDERRPVKYIEPKRLHTSNDPYGEEDWD